MITLLDIHRQIGLSLTQILRDYYKVHYEPISRQNTHVVKVSLVHGGEETAGRRQVMKSVTFDIAFIAYPERYDTVPMLEVFERIKATFLPSFQVKDRFLKPSLEIRFTDGGLNGFGIMVTFDYLDTLEHITIDDDLVIIDKEDETEIENPDGTVDILPLEKMMTLYLELESD